MSTIPDTMRDISRDIQNTFEELVKLLLRRSLRPVLNPLKQNCRVVYNRNKRRYERGFVGSLSDDNINKYSYLMTNESLGWSGEILANFKINAKFMKNCQTPYRFPAGNAKTHNSLKSRARVAFCDKEGKNSPMTHYKNFLTFLTSRSMQSVIANKQAAFTYSADIPYTHAFKKLESIGRDIIDQTDPSIRGEDSARMSTAMLRVKLYNLEQLLGDLSVCNPNIFDAYIEMLRIINSTPRCKMNWVINLIGALSYQNWSDMPDSQQKSYLDALGEDFVCAFNSNELIIILLQSDSSELIITSAYLFPLLKMLFIVFGYSKLVPAVTTNYCEESQSQLQARLRKHLDKYRGATFRRGDEHCANYPIDTKYSEHYDSQCDSDTNSSNTSEIPEQSIPNIVSSNPTGTNTVKPDPEPFDQCIYEFIRLFGDLYPTIIGLMGGTEEFPPESIEIGCNDIPADYDYLTSLPEYLWRYNDYSYCRNLEHIASKQMPSFLDAKINSKTRYLHSI